MTFGRIIVTSDLPHPACAWGRPLAHDENGECRKHPGSPAVAELFYPTRMVCAECFKTFEETGR